MLQSSERFPQCYLRRVGGIWARCVARTVGCDFSSSPLVARRHPPALETSACAASCKPSCGKAPIAVLKVLRGVGVHRVQRGVGQKRGELTTVLTQVRVVVRGVEELRFERDQQWPVKARRPEEAFPDRLASAGWAVQSNNGSKCVSVQGRSTRNRAIRRDASSTRPWRNCVHRSVAELGKERLHITGQSLSFGSRLNQRFSSA